MDDLTTDRSFDSQVTCVIGVLGVFFDLLSIGCLHWQTSGRLVQELNVCTVYCHYTNVPLLPLSWGYIKSRPSTLPGVVIGEISTISKFVGLAARWL